MVCLSADQLAQNILESNGVDVKRSKLEGRSGILTWKWTREYPSRPDEGMLTATAPMEIPTVPPPTPPPEEHVPEMRGQGVHAKALKDQSWSGIGRTLPGMRPGEVTHS